MNKRFTKLIAALALLVGLTIPMGIWGQSTYTKVTTAPSDWSGTYVIVADESNVIFTGQSGTNNYGGYAAVTISNNSVTGDFTAYEVEIEQSGENYSIKHITSTKYLGLTSDGNNLNFSTQAPADNKYRWILSTNEIVPASYSETRRLQYNSASSGLRFACYKKTQKDAFLYKKEAGSTTTCATPTFSPAAGTYTEAQTVSINCATENSTIYYTTDGTDPTTNSTVYNNPISVSSNMTIKAMATATDYDNSAIATAEYTIITLNHAGTLEDPYTVADARAAIDANAGTQGVYARGIVSEIVSAYSTQYGNITFNMVDEEGDEIFLQAYRCTGDEAANVVVGASAIVSGNLTKYNSTYEFAQNCQLVQLTLPTYPIINADETLALEYNATLGEIGYTVTNPVTGVALDATTTADWISNIGVGESAVTFACTANEGTADRTATVTLSYEGAENVIVTVTQGHFVADYATLPFVFNGGVADIESTAGLTQEGLGSDYSNSPKLKFDGTGDWLILHFNEQPGTLTFDIKNNSFSGGTFTVQTSEDGVTYTDLETYTEITGTQNEEFTDLGENVRYIKWIYTNKSSGNVGLGNIALAKYVAPVPAITVESTTITATAAETEGTLNVTYTAIETSLGASIYWYTDATGVTVTDEPEWVSAEINETTLTVDYIIAANEGEARTAYFKVYALDDEANEVYSDLVTVSQAAYVAPFEGGTYTLATSIEEGRIYIIVGKDEEDAYAMGDQNNNNRGAVGISIDDNTATVEEGIEAYEFYIESLGEGSLYCIYDFRKEGFLYAASSSSNYLRTEDALDNNGKWNITFNQDGVASIVAQGDYTRNVMQYNSVSTLFSCYASDSQNPVYLYVKEEETPEPEIYELTINGYTDAESKAGYYLIASPVTVNIADVAGLTEGDFDLYSYDESQELEWINYKQEDGSHPFTTLEPGKGYLYAKKATAETPTYTFTLAGTPYDGTPIVLSKQSTGTLAGWNLIGNPSATSNIAPGHAFYIMNSTIGELIASESSTVEPKQGFFVIATEDGEEFEWTAPLDGNLGKVVMNLSRNRGTVVDRAIVRFGEGDQLPKFQLNPNNTKIYFAQADNDYAVVRSANEGEMPVSFRASENGTYTLSFSAENTEMRYMHLIDNMTGNDIDLLQTPSYTFEAKTSDYASRFRLVFNANNGVDEMDEDQFAFFNGSEWMVSNLGEATLQVVDVMGRVLSTETISGNAELSLNQPAGVYMLRLINGNDVKVQKVIVK